MSSIRLSGSRPLRLAAAVWLGGWLTAGQLDLIAAQPEFAVIVSASVPVDDLSLSELRRIFLFKRTVWKPGQAVGLLLPGGVLPSRRFVLSQIYRMSDDELRRFILERLFQAEIDFAPKVVGSDRDAVAFVASGRSLIAIVGSDAPNLSTVKTVRIDGKLPGDPGYHLVQK